MMDAVQELRQMDLFVWPRPGGKVGFRPATPWTLEVVKARKPEILETFDSTPLTHDRGVVFGSGFWFRSLGLGACHWCGHSTVERRYDGEPMHVACQVSKRAQKMGMTDDGAVLLMDDGTPDPEPEKWKRQKPPYLGPRKPWVKKP